MVEVDKQKTRFCYFYDDEVNEWFIIDFRWNAVVFSHKKFNIMKMIHSESVEVIPNFENKKWYYKETPTWA